MMDDLISRQATIDALEKNKEMINAVLDSLTLDYNARRNLEQRRGQINEDVETIKELPSAQSEPRWIPVTERLPEMFEHVYASVRSEGREDWVIDVWYDPYLTCPWGDVPMLKSGQAVVYAWMPVYIPEPWRGKRDE